MSDDQNSHQTWLPALLRIENWIKNRMKKFATQVWINYTTVMFQVISLFPFVIVTSDKIITKLNFKKSF